MPNRIIKESICTSDEIDQLSPEQEVLFYRLMVVVDDFGLIDARLPILKSKCYPLKSIDINSIQANLARLVEVGLVKLYRVEGKPYLSITNWAKHQQIRAQRAKYPMPEEGEDITCNQLISDAPVIQSNPIQSESESNPNPISEPKGSSSALQAKTDPPPRLNGKTAMVEQVMAYLNTQARRNYRAKNPNGTPTAGAMVIAQRLKEGYTVDQCKDVIGEKSNQWMGDEKMDQYLNPQTLFRKSNFDKYLTEAEAQQ